MRNVLALVLILAALTFANSCAPAVVPDDNDDLHLTTEWKDKCSDLYCGFVCNNHSKHITCRTSGLFSVADDVCEKEAKRKCGSHSVENYCTLSNYDEFVGNSRFDNNSSCCTRDGHDSALKVKCDELVYF